MADSSRKSNRDAPPHDHAAAPGTSAALHGAPGDHGGGNFKEQDRLLPIANVGRIMKRILPPNAKVSKEVKETVQECVSEFISFVTGEASDKCHKEKRKTVNGDDICWALGTLGFDDYAAPMNRYLQKYREIEGDRAAVRGGGGASSAGDDSRDHVAPDRSN
ncbi:nuclear transcription factor Y subunit B-1 [Canna indica]|uniref:Nuclear transcription factor Y subunit B-1 n=1 Tax=Canna indica TaxID=4628 RepID=A0AAQ3KMY4_9LILI|nr:nuclear transcription factor Y subunit B-1 [Canna indica]